MKAGKVTIRAGFVVLVTLLVWLDQGGLLWVVFTAALCHELGHYIPTRIFGGKIVNLELTGGGIDMQISQNLSYGKELAAILGGPLSSLAFALVFSLKDGIIPGQAAIAGMCLSHAVFNLLPMRGLDGGRALELILLSATNGRGRLALNITTAITAAALGVLCGVMAYYNRNPSLLAAMVYILSSAVMGNKKAKSGDTLASSGLRPK